MSSCCGQNMDAFDVRVNILQKTLQESVKSELENAALQYGADKIVRNFRVHWLLQCYFVCHYS